MAQCCPLYSECDNYATLYESKIVKSRKVIGCEECAQPIQKGERYEYVKGMTDGHFWTVKTCLVCAEIRDHFRCEDGISHGALWRQLREGFLPTMSAGGPCMDGLSPAAKSKLFDAHLVVIGFRVKE